MCLGVPGRILEIYPNAESPRFLEARVDFGGVTRVVSLAGAPEAAVGQYVVVHAGFALHVIDEAEAQRVHAYLDEIGELKEEIFTPETQSQREADQP